MTIKIGHARIDENGNAHSGKAGDNNGKEVMVSNWYLHSKGWVVLRPVDTAKAEKIAKCMENACANNCIGYNQYKRLTLYNAVKNNGFKCDSASLKTNVETDCSALVRVCLAYAGITTDNFTTANQKKIMLATGAFVEVPEAETNSALLKRGDVLLTKTKGHTVIVLTSGTGTATEKDEETVKITLKVLKKGSKNAQVKTLQHLLTDYGYSLGNVDGDFGNKTLAAVKEFQKANGLAVDGSVGEKTWGKLLNA